MVRARLVHNRTCEVGSRGRTVGTPRRQAAGRSRPRGRMGRWPGSSRADGDAVTCGTAPHGDNVSARRGGLLAPTGMAPFDNAGPMAGLVPRQRQSVHRAGSSPGAPSPIVSGDLGTLQQAAGCAWHGVGYATRVRPAPRRVGAATLVGGLGAFRATAESMGEAELFHGGVGQARGTGQGRCIQGPPGKGGVAARGRGVPHARGQDPGRAKPRGRGRIRARGFPERSLRGAGARGRRLLGSGDQGPAAASGG